MKCKRGQETGSGAAALVALIATFVVLFIVFLPPDERAIILDGGSSNNENNSHSSSEGDLLVLENPGSIVPPLQNFLTYPIAPVEVSTSSEANELDSAPILSIKESLFTSKLAESTFEIDKPELTDNVLLSMTIKKADGNLNIDWNGKNIVSREFIEGQINPIEIPSRLLKEENTLTFSTDSVGAAFWSSNSYVIEDMSVTADIQDRSSSVAQSTFYVPSNDLDRFKSARLFFLPVCTPDSGILSVDLNGVSVYKSKPVCDSIGGVDFNPADFILPGNNKIKFSTDSGVYSLTRMRISSEPKEPEQYVYFFKVPSDLYEDVYVGDVSIIASLKFIDRVNEKEGALVTNGYVRSFDVRNDGYALDISDFIEEGFNAIEIIPRDPFIVTEFRVEII